MIQWIAEYLSVHEIPSYVVDNECSCTATSYLVQILIFYLSYRLYQAILEAGFSPWSGAVHPPHSIRSLNLLWFGHQEVYWYESTITVHRDTSWTDSSGAYMKCTHTHTTLERIAHVHMYTLRWMAQFIILLPIPITSSQNGGLNEIWATSH